jgi:ELWxxDGT repeat protein
MQPFLLGLILSSVLSAGLMAGGDAAIVKDINRYSHRSSRTVEIVEFQGRIYFSGFDLATGWELWSSDGTGAGTRLSVDLEPGPGSSFPDQLTVAGDLLYFRAYKPGTGLIIFRTDGTPEGTAPVPGVGPGIGNTISILGSAGHRLLFVSDQGDGNGSEPWTTDGTPEGTSILKDLSPGPANGGASVFTGWGDRLLFSSLSGQEPELWITDGTPAGTMRVRDLLPAIDVWTYPRVLPDGRLALLARDGRLWRSDGTPAGTGFVLDVTPRDDQIVEWITATAAAGIFFTVYSPQEQERLWISDYTPQGTREIFPTFGLVGQERGGTAYFTVYGNELWTSRGTAESTHPIGYNLLDPFHFLVSENSVLFAVKDLEIGAELFRAGALSTGASLVKDIFPGPPDSYPQDLTAALGQVFFVANNASGAGLWKTDGTSEGTELVKRNLFPGLDGSDPGNLVVVNGLALFRANNGAHGDELWAMGRDANPYLLKDIYPGSEDSYISDLTVSGGQAFFAARDFEHGKELWQSDGSPEGTFLVADLNPGGQGLEPQDLTPMGDAVYFQAPVPGTGRYGSALWRSDRTAESTGLVKDLPAEGWSMAFEMVNTGGFLVFGAHGPSGRTGLWRSDGTPEGTALYKEFTGVGLGRLTAARGAVYFMAKIGDAGGGELWRTDGTLEGTELVRFFPPEPGAKYFNLLLHGAPDKLFLHVYQFQDVNSSFTVWASDGTDEGTRPVHEKFLRNVESWGLGAFQLTGGSLYFQADDGQNGSELWRSDGTPEGTSMVTDLAPGPASSAPSVLASANGVVYFLATPEGASPPPRYDAYQYGRLFRSDGTPEGTRELAPGAHDIFQVFRGRLYFSAYDSSFGTELWSVQVEDAPPLRGDATGDGALDISDPVSILGCLFLGKTCPPTTCAMDVNSDGEEDVSDAVFLLEYLFLGGRPPADC